jgi:hypothetical protein
MALAIGRQAELAPRLVDEATTLILQLHWEILPSIYCLANAKIFCLLIGLDSFEMSGRPQTIHAEGVLLPQIHRGNQHPRLRMFRNLKITTSAEHV